MSTLSLKSTPYNAHLKTVNHLAWCPQDANKLASASSDFSSRVWTAKSGGLTCKNLHVKRMFSRSSLFFSFCFFLSRSHPMCSLATLDLVGHKKNVMQLCWAPQQDSVLATASCDKTVRLWDVRVPKCVAVVDTRGENINVTFSRDGSKVVVGNKKDLISWIDVKMHKVVGEFACAVETNEFGYDLNGDVLLATTGKGSVDVYQGEVEDKSLQLATSLHAHAASCYSLSFSSTGLFAVGSADGLVSVWSRAELICFHTVSRFKATVRTTGFSHDGLYLASGSEEGLIDVSRMPDGAQMAFHQTSTPINSLSWNPSSHTLAYAADKTVHLLA